MTRLQSEWHRLYHPHSPPVAPGLDTNSSINLIDPGGRVHAMALTVSRPADWAALSLAWQGVQSDLGLPAPGIAVSGVDGYQLWFSLEEAVPVPQAHAFLDAVRQRYLGHIAPARIGLLPAAAPDAELPSWPAWPACTVPPQPTGPEQWSAFVAPDLAPVFADTPWLDIPPSLDGQAELLSRLQRIQPDAWQAASAQASATRASAAHTAAASSATGVSAAAAAATGAPAAHTAAAPSAAGPHQDPRQFLLDVMNDDTVALALRIEAAKALLPYGLTTGHEQGP